MILNNELLRFTEASIFINVAISWLNKLNFGVTDTDKNKDPCILMNMRDREDVVVYRTRFCNRWFNKYLPRMTYFEGENMKPVDP